MTDGTRDFLRGLPHWANLIALEAGGDVVVGVLHLPVLGRLYTATRGGGAWRDGVRLEIADAAIRSRCLLVFGEPDCILDATDADAFARLVRTVGSARGYGAPYSAALLLDGQADRSIRGLRRLLSAHGPGDDSVMRAERPGKPPAVSALPGAARQVAFRPTTTPHRSNRRRILRHSTRAPARGVRAANNPVGWPPRGPIPLPLGGLDGARPEIVL